MWTAKKRKIVGSLLRIYKRLRLGLVEDREMNQTILAWHEGEISTMLMEESNLRFLSRVDETWVETDDRNKAFIFDNPDEALAIFRKLKPGEEDVFWMEP